MTQHTPGPWKRAGKASEQIVAASNIPLAVIRATGHEDRWQANTRLIAAAPELLEALEQLEALGVSGLPGWADAMMDARAAIAKATGGECIPNCTDETLPETWDVADETDPEATG